MISLGTIIIFSILAVIVITIFVFIVKSLFAPKKIDSIKKLIKQGKYSSAQKTAKALVTKNPHDYEAHYWLGEAYLADNKTELAFMEYKLVNQNAVFNGDIPESQFRKKMASLYQKYNQPQQALAEYLLLTKMEPANPDYTYNIGKIYDNSGRSDVALGYYKKTIQFNPRHSQAHASLGFIYYKTKQFLDAKKEIELAIRISPETYSNYYYLGKILKDGKEYSKALSAFEKAERDPVFKQRSLLERGACFMAANQLDNAAIEFDRAVKATKEPSSQETLYARYYLAACYEKSRKIEKALEQWEQIYIVSHTFKDVSAKLNEFKDITNNDLLKEYLTSGADDFCTMCRKIALNSLKMNASQCSQTRYGATMTATEVKSDNWKDLRQQVYLLEFYRDAEPIDDSVIRTIADKVKQKSFGKAFVISSSGFTRPAVVFAENRPLELIDKSKLEKLLSVSGI